MKKNEFTQTNAYKKGEIGEKINDNVFFSEYDFIPYASLINISHPFDRLFVSKNKREIIIVEVKTKEYRDHYPDTGFNIKNYNEYMYIYKKYNLRFYISFIDIRMEHDQHIGWIYGNWLDILNKKKIIIHNKKELTYPLFNKNIVYFPIENMKYYYKLDENQKRDIGKFTNRNKKYDNGYVDRLIYDENAEKILKKIKEINTSPDRRDIIKELIRLFPTNE